MMFQQASLCAGPVARVGSSYIGVVNAFESWVEKRDAFVAIILHLISATTKALFLLAQKTVAKTIRQRTHKTHTIV